MNQQRLPFTREDYFRLLDEKLNPNPNPNPQMALQRFIEQRKGRGVPGQPPGRNGGDQLVGGLE